MEKSSIISAIAGFSGSLSYLFLYPLEFVKINIVAGDGYSKNHIPYYKTSREAFISMYKANGFLSFYKGCHVSLFSSVAWTLYFYIYDLAKHRYAKLKDHYPNTYKFLVASEASILSRVITSPLWTIKTRLVLQRNSSSWYGDTIETVKKIWKTDGLQGYFAGLVPGLMLCSNGILNLYFYEVQKEFFGMHGGLAVGLYGVNSKLLSSFVTYPIQLVMIKLQQEQYSHTILEKAANVKHEAKKEKFFTGSVNCIKTTLRNEGVKGLYRGLPLQLIRTLPGNGVFFILYEYSLIVLNRIL